MKRYFLLATMALTAAVHGQQNSGLDFSDLSAFKPHVPNLKQYCQHKFLETLGWSQPNFYVAGKRNAQISQSANGICEMANTNQKPGINVPVFTGGLDYKSLKENEKTTVMKQAAKRYAEKLDELVSADNRLAVCGYKKLVRSQLVPNISALHGHTKQPTNKIVHILNDLNSRRDDRRKTVLAFPLEMQGHPDHDKFMIRYDNPQTCGWEPAIVTPKNMGEHTQCAIPTGKPSDTIEGYIKNANGGCTIDCAVGLQKSQLVGAYGPYRALGSFGKEIFDKGWKKEDCAVGLFPLIKDVHVKQPGIPKAGRNPFYNEYYVDGKNEIKPVQKSIDPYGTNMAKNGRFHVVGAAGYIGLTKEKYNNRLHETTARGLNFMIVDIGGNALQKLASGELEKVQARRKGRWFFSRGRPNVPKWLNEIMVYSHPNKKYETMYEAMVHMLEINPDVEYEITLYPDTFNKMLYERFRDDFVEGCMAKRRAIQN